MEEFTAQGVDLSNIIKTLTGGDISSHPAAQAVQRAEKAAKGADPEGAAAAADDVAAALVAANSKETAAEVAAVLHKAGAAGALVQCMPACAGAPAQELRILNAVAVLLGSSRELQTDFLQAHGAAALQQVLGEQSEDASLAAAALQAAAAVAAKNEEGKAALMAAGLGGSSLEAMQRHADQPEVLQAACDVLCALTNPDDDTQPASRCALASSADDPKHASCLGWRHLPSGPVRVLASKCCLCLPAGRSLMRVLWQRRALQNSWWQPCVATMRTRSQWSPRCPMR